MNVNRIALVFAKKPASNDDKWKRQISPVSSFIHTQPHSHLLFAQREPIFCGLCQQPSSVIRGFFYKLWKRQGLKKCMKIVDVMA